MERQHEQPPDYVFGHTDHELQRLIEQSSLFGYLTEQLLVKAGIGTGMQVLDLGCGAGDVTFLIAKFIGSTGKVIGIDKSHEAISTARKRLAATKVRNVTFIENDIMHLSLDHAVDGIVGRFLLMYQSDPTATLRHVTRHVRQDGIVAFQEMDFTYPPACLPKVAIFEKAVEWIIETLRRGQVETQMGLKLHRTFVDAGLPAPQMLLSARVESGHDSPFYDHVAQTVQSLLPMMEALGVTTAQEVQVETLAARLSDEVVKAEGVITSQHLIGAWARKIR